VRLGIEAYVNRNPDRVRIPEGTMEMMAGFSVEAILEALGGTPEPLVEAIKAGKIRGAVGVVGCNNPKIQHDYGHVNLVKELIKQDVLVVTTGCNAIATAKAGLMLPEAAEQAGEGLKSVCQALGVPPVLHMGSCVDISRILVACAAIANALGVDISDLPVAGAAPEWMSEKALSIGTYFVASGVYVIFGTKNPVSGSEEIMRLISQGWESKVGGKLEFIEEAEEIVRRAIEHIDKKRADLGLAEYDPSKWGQSGDSRMAEVLELPLEERLEAVYGGGK